MTGHKHICTEWRLQAAVLVLLALLCCIPGGVWAAALQLPKVPQSLMLDITRQNGRLIAVGERGHIIYSDDRGGNWHQSDVPVRQMLTAVHFAHPALGWAVGHDGLILNTLDGARSWQIQRDKRPASSRSTDAQPAPVAPPLLDVWFADERNGWAIGAFGTLLHTDDGGEQWQDVSARIDNAAESHYYGIAGDASGRLFIAGESGGLYRSFDAGQHWQQLTSLYEGSWFGLLYQARSGLLLAFGLQGRIYRSTDFGDSWSRVPNDHKLSLAGGATGPLNRMVLVGGVGTVLDSDDGGLSFGQHMLPERLHLSAAVFDSHGQLHVAGQGGVHRLDLSQTSGSPTDGDTGHDQTQ